VLVVCRRLPTDENFPLIEEGPPLYTQHFLALLLGTCYCYRELKVSSSAAMLPSSYSRILLLFLLLHTTTAQLDHDTLMRFRSFGFGMISYYDVVSDKTSQQELITFVKEHNITFVNQYVCSVTTASDYAYFVDNLYNQTGAKINLLFDDTLVEHSHNSTCDIECRAGSSTGDGWCCASVARKFTWMVDVLTLTTRPEAIDGAAFDIEGLKARDYMDLWTTMRVHWNSTVAPVKGQQVLRWYFGSIMADLAVQAVSEGLIDHIYWENYQNTDAKYVARARRLLDPLSTMYANATRVITHGPPVCLLSEINCCATPCVHSNACGLCGTYELEERSLISFCDINKVPSKASQNSYQRKKHLMDVGYMLETMEQSRKQLIHMDYFLLLAPNVLYDFRAIFMKIYGRDTVGNHLCPKVLKTEIP
jgi:hypothetical protein